MDKTPRPKPLERVAALLGRLTEPASTPSEAGLRYWQERVISTILLTGIVLGLFAYVPSLLLCIKEGLWGIALLDTALYVMVWILFLFPTIPFGLRAHAVVYSSFLLGMVLLATVGPGASGPVWLFLFPVLACMLLGVSSSVFALVLNVAVLLATGVLIHLGESSWMIPRPHTPARWLVITLNFILLNGVAVMSLGMILKGLNRSLEDEKILRKELERKIGEQYETAQKLKASEERYRNILESMQEGYLEVDLAGNLTFFNSTMCKILGRSKEELVGMNYRQYMDEQASKEVYKIFNSVYRTGRPIKVAGWRHTKKDGSKCLVEGSVSLITGRDGDPVGFKAVVRDITERVNLENKLLQAQKLESIGRLAAGIAHDYNNTIAAISGFAEVAMESLDPDNPAREDLKEIISASKHAADITKQLMGFARKQMVAPESVDLNRKVEEMLGLLRRFVGENIELKWSPGRDLWRVRIDPSQVDNILTNLCANARDAIKTAGVVTIRTENFVADENYCKNNAADLAPGEYVAMIVTDTGCGMDKEVLGNIFEPFFTTKGRASASGLGLASVYGIVKQNKGHVSVESEPGRGSTFTVLLPRQIGENGDPGRK